VSKILYKLGWACRPSQHIKEYSSHLKEFCGSADAESQESLSVVSNCALQRARVITCRMMKAENCMEEAKAAPVAALQGAACVCRPPQAASGAAAAPQRWYLAQVGPACGPPLPARSPTVLLNGSPGSGVLLRLQGTVYAHILISSLPHTAQLLDSLVIRWKQRMVPSEPSARQA